ncbi:hypothetical protein KM043_012617 [Ampulex compressa]|nr:hypothetical protein KM043_012617 [Ampulex compressa]
MCSNVPVQAVALCRREEDGEPGQRSSVENDGPGVEAEEKETQVRRTVPAARCSSSRKSRKLRPYTASIGVYIGFARFCFANLTDNWLTDEAQILSGALDRYIAENMLERLAAVNTIHTGVETIVAAQPVARCIFLSRQRGHLLNSFRKAMS